MGKILRFIIGMILIILILTLISCEPSKNESDKHIDIDVSKSVDANGNTSTDDSNIRDNEYSATLNDFQVKIYKGDKVIYSDDLSINPIDTTQRRSELFETLMIELSSEYSSKPNNYFSSFKFSNDNQTFFAIYSIDNLSNIFLKVDLNNQESQIFIFNDHGTYNDKNFKFNPNTGDVLYAAGNIYPPYRHEENNLNDYDFLWTDSNKIEHKYDETEKFIYLRNIYTQEMFLVDKVENTNQNNYTYNFTKDDKVEINGKIVEKDIKTKKNLVYAECKSNKIDSIKTNSNILNSVLKINEEAANEIPKFIKDNYNIDSKVLQTMTYNNVTYAVVNISNYYISDGYKKIDINDGGVYKYSDSSLELWRYENGNCKRLLYYQTYFSIFNMVSDEGYLMISGERTNPGYIVKFNKNNNILYEAKYKGFLKSPNRRYALIYNSNESFAVVENDKIIIDYKIQGNDDINKFWTYTVLEQGPCWWDLEFNKLYVMLENSINPLADIYCVDLINKNVEKYDTIKYSSRITAMNKVLNYICTENSVFTGSYLSNLEKLYTDRKYYNYIYNLRTNEKIYFTDYSIFDETKLNDNFIIYRGYDIELKIDISPYINEDRISYIKNLKDFIIKNHDKSINISNIELCLIFNTTQGKYQIVKINNDKEKPYYELWKIDNGYERIIDKANNMFLTNNQEYLCITSKNGEIKIYDNNFNCIIDQKIYSENLLKKYNLESLDTPLYYIMKFDKNIFLPIKGNNNLADVVNVDLVNKKISYLGHDLDCNYDNFAINPKMGYLIYQSGPSIARYNKQSEKEIYLSDLNETLILLNLITNEEAVINKDELDKYLCSEF